LPCQLSPNVMQHVMQRRWAPEGELPAPTTHGPSAKGPAQAHSVGLPLDGDIDHASNGFPTRRPASEADNKELGLSLARLAKGILIVRQRLDLSVVDLYDHVAPL